MRYIIEIERSDEIRWAPGERWLVAVVEQSTAQTHTNIGAFPSFRDAAAAAVALTAWLRIAGEQNVEGAQITVTPMRDLIDPTPRPSMNVTIEDLLVLFR